MRAAQQGRRTHAGAGAASREHAQHLSLLQQLRPFQGTEHSALPLTIHGIVFVWAACFTTASLSLSNEHAWIRCSSPWTVDIFHHEEKKCMNPGWGEGKKREKCLIIP